uniref:Mortality factor 4 like 1 n=1 Tax=Eptatretus burgeri TaxID=7764 RepID=A0A8C4NGG3_EPTBU
MYNEQKHLIRPIRLAHTFPYCFAGERVLCFHGPLLYEAKCVKILVKDKHIKYFVHYNGWNKNWDEWVPETRVLKYVDTNLQKQKDLQRSEPVSHFQHFYNQDNIQDHKDKPYLSMVKDDLKNYQIQIQIRIFTEIEPQKHTQHVHQVSSKYVHNFLRYPVYKQTHTSRQTDRGENKLLHLRWRR